MPPPHRHPTHFLAIPLAPPSALAPLSLSLTTFRDHLLSSPHLASVAPVEAIRPPGTLHLTLGVMALGRDNDVSVLGALEALRGVVKGVDTGMEMETEIRRGMSVDLRGLRGMSGGDSEGVFYAEAVPRGISTESFYNFCSVIRNAMTQQGFLIDENRLLKLHATIYNTVYIKGRPSPGAKGKRKERVMVPKEVAEGWEDFVWAEDIPVVGIGIYRMGAQKVGGAEGERYEEVGLVEI